MPSAHDHLQGLWAIDTLEMDGRPVPPAAYAGALLTITGNRFTSTGMGAEYAGTVSIQAPVAPAAHGSIDLHFDTGPEAGNTNYGLFEITATGWRLCLASQGPHRPTAFEAPPGTGIALETFVRPTSPQPPSDEGASAPGPGDEALDGNWQMVSGIVDGVPMDPAMAQWVRRVTSGDETTVTAGPQVLMKFTTATNPAADPKTIDYQHLAGANKGTTQSGIYKLEDGRLTIHMAPPGAPRPDDYEPGPKSSLTTWTRPLKPR